MERDYLIRVTRIPLDPVARERMRHDDALPEDYRSRAIEEHDFVNVSAQDDASAARAAREVTSLVFKGEKAVIQEVMGDGTFRLLDTDLDIYDLT